MKIKRRGLASIALLAVFASALPAPFLTVPTVTAQIVNPAQAAAGIEALRLGRALLKRGQADQALLQFTTALQAFQQVKRPKGVAAANDALGDLYLQQGQYKIALRYYRDAYDSFNQAKAQQGVAENAVGFPDNEYNASLMLAKIGQANLQAGDIAGASSAFGQMYAAKPDPTRLANINKSDVVPSKPSVGGILGGSRPSLGGLLGGGKPKAPTVNVPTNIGGALGKTRAFVEYYRQTVIYSTRQLGAGRIAYLKKDYDTANKSFNEALGSVSLPLIDSLSQMRRVRAAARNALGDVALQQNKPKDAVKFYQEALKGAQADKRLDLTWPAQRGLARSQWLLAQSERDAKKSLAMRDSALAGYRDALATIETLRAGSLRADEARTTFLATTADVYDEAAQLAADSALLAANQPNGGTLTGAAANYAAEGFKFTEQGRARSLLEMLGETGVNITSGVPADLVKRKQDNLARQQEIAAQLTGLALNETDQDAPDAKKLDDELDQLTADYNAIENEIRAANPRYAVLTAPQPLSLSEVQQNVVDADTVLLAYHLSATASYLWAVTSNSLALYKLPPRDKVNEQARALRAQIIPARLQRRLVGIDVATDTRGLGVGVATLPPSEGVANFATASNALYQTAVAPAASVIGNKRLLIVADGALNYVPFEALTTATTGADYSSLPYLIATNEVAYAPSASVVGYLRQSAQPAPSGKSVLIVADPVFYGADPRARNAVASIATNAASGESRGLGLGLTSSLSDVSGSEVAPPNAGAAAGLPLGRLLGTRAEAQQITALARQNGGTADTWLDLDAAEGNLNARDLKKYRYLHFATHGLLNAERPQFTGVVLSLVGNKSGDGFLRTDEIFNLQLSRSLVMLSACETGLGREQRGEGVLGLTRAFMYAGAPTVGVSLWSVADNSTAQLMTDFYKKQLATPNASPTASLRAAQRAMIASKKFSAPFYWSPFVLNGDWK